MLDFGPHRLHRSIDQIILADLRSFPGIDLALRRRHGLIRVNGRFLPYPIGPSSLPGLGAAMVVRLATGAVAARLLRTKRPTDSYESRLCSRVGRPLYELFYGPFAEKVWGRPGTEISADQADRRVNQRGLGDLLRALLGRGSARHYLYPKGGFGRITDAYAAALRRSPGVRLIREAQVEKLGWSDDRITDVTWRDVTGEHTTPVEHLVWTAPLPEILRRMDPKPPETVTDAANGLVYRSVVMCYVAFRKPGVGFADTYYFPERRFPFNRVIEQKRFSQDMIPADRTVLGMDLACEPDDATYQSSDKELGALVVPALAQAGLARSDEVIEVFSRRLRTAYPIYTRGYATDLGVAESWLSRFENLWLLGRQALFLHNNTHHSLLMGYRSADAIGSGNRSGWVDSMAALSSQMVED